MYGFSTPTIIHALTTYYFLLVSLTEVLTLEEQSPSYQMELCDVQAGIVSCGERGISIAKTFGDCVVFYG